MQEKFREEPLKVFGPFTRPICIDSDNLDIEPEVKSLLKVMLSFRFPS